MAKPSTPSSTSPGGSGGGGEGRGGSSSRESSSKALVADQISQAVQSTSNLLHLMLQSSPSQATLSLSLNCCFLQPHWYLVHLAKLPKNLLAKTSTIKNTERVLEQMPQVISSLDAHMENGLQSVPHLKTVTQLLENIESCQLKSLSRGQLSQKESEPVDKLPEAG